MKNPRILLLDEATAALDNKSELQLQIAIKSTSLSKNSIFLLFIYKSLIKIDRTAIIIAHRLSTIQHADNILVLEQGHVIEMGTHHLLMEKKEQYFQLVQTQLIDEQMDRISEERTSCQDSDEEEQMESSIELEEKKV